MSKDKHTKEYAKELALRKAPVIGEEFFVSGYMKAIEETAAPKMLEALKLDACFPITTKIEEENTYDLAKSLGWKMDMPVENFAIKFRNEAIKSATE